MFKTNSSELRDMLILFVDGVYKICMSLSAPTFGKLDGQQVRAELKFSTNIDIKQLSASTSKSTMLFNHL